MELREALKTRRSRYGLTKKSTISDDKLEEIVREAVQYTPSAFHSQSSKAVLLLGEEHEKLWAIVMDTLREKVPAEKFAPTEEKVNSFAAGYGTVLFFEDMDVVAGLQEAFPGYSENFPVWSNQSSGMLQSNVWMLLAAEGIGASLQHYNPLIDEKVKATFGVEGNYKLISQMPFGIAVDQPRELEYKNLDERVKVLGK